MFRLLNHTDKAAWQGDGHDDDDDDDDNDDNDEEEEDDILAWKSNKKQLLLIVFQYPELCRFANESIGFESITTSQI